MLHIFGSVFPFFRHAFESAAAKQRRRVQGPCLESLEDRRLLSSYLISGKFGADYKGFPSTGLASGSFVGTFTATLPSSSSATITTFQIKMLNASGSVVASITSTHKGDIAYFSPATYGTGKREILNFYNGKYGLQLDFASPLPASGPIIPTDTFKYSTYGSSPTSFVTIPSGAISVDAELDIDGMPVNQKANPGGLVVMNSDGNNAPRAEITIQKSPYPEVLTESNDKVKVFTAATGGTQIAFDGVHNVFASASLPIHLYVEGSKYSNTMRDVELDITAKSPIPGSDAVKFTVLWVDQPTVKLSHSDKISSDNTAIGEYEKLTLNKSDNLGLQSYTNGAMGWGNQVQAIVHPSGFTYPGITTMLARDVDAIQWINDNGKLIKGHVYSFINLLDNNDPASPEYRDDVPSKTTGNIYMFDAPGVGIFVPESNGYIQRWRSNFTAFAMITLTVNGVSTNVQASPITTYFIDFSIEQIDSPQGTKWVIVNDVSGDNQAGLGTKKLTWNLK